MYYQIGVLSSFTLLLIIIHLHLTINSFEKQNATLSVYLCSQFPSSQGYFQNNFTDSFLLNYPKICKPDDILLIYILSKVEHIQQRKRIRQTWANKYQYGQLFQTCFIFLIGLTNDSQQIFSEAKTYGDLVQVNINETDESNVYQEIAGLKWSYIYASHIPYLFKTRDSIMIDTLLLSDITRLLIDNRIVHSDYLQKHYELKNFTEDLLFENKYTLFKGTERLGIKTIRRGKFALNYLAWNGDYLPEYCSSAGYLLSSLIRDRLYQASLCFAKEYVLPMGDLFVSGFLANAASVRCSNWRMEYLHASHSCAEYFQKQPQLLLCSTSMDFDDQGWPAILYRHSLTNQTIEESRRKYIALLQKQFKQKSIIKESIIEQIQNNSIDQDFFLRM
ncbi:hypothetical protein I4U23_023496 [Adineta vaga]|nr:hypothetical protein I4U23_023496 [Adineta vaga]